MTPQTQSSFNCMPSSSWVSRSAVLMASWSESSHFPPGKLQKQISYCAREVWEEKVLRLLGVDGDSKSQKVSWTSSGSIANFVRVLQ